MNQKQFNELDIQFEQFLDSINLSVEDNELTAELAAKRRKIADADDFQFCKIYFPAIFTDPFNAIHVHISELKTGQHSVSGCRHFGKTAFGYVTKLIKKIALGGSGLLGLGLRTQDDAIERTSALVRLMSRNKKLMYDYNVQIQQDRKGDYIINNKQFVAFGFREGLRTIIDDEFKRFEIIILDDIFNRQSISSEKDNEKVFNFVDSECSGQLRPDGLLIWFFNFISENSPGKRYADENPDTHFNLPARNDEGHTNWPGSYWTDERLKEKEESLSFDVWMGDWMNNPQLKGEIFDKDWIRTVRINTLQIIASLTAVDPSHGQSPAACHKGVVTMGITADRECVMLDVYLRKEDYSRMFDYIDNIRNSFPNFRAVLFENDFNQWFTAAPYYNSWCERKKKYLPIIPYSAKILKTDDYGSDKEGRIMNLVHPFQTGKLVVNDTIVQTPDYKRWQSQYVAFGKSKEKLDGLDAAATAFIMLPRYMATGKFKSLKSRMNANQFNSWLTGR